MLCERYPDPRERGRQFEPRVAQLLRTDKKFRDRYAEVWRLCEWTRRRSGDIGVDIFARGQDGGLTAIQSKCYDPASMLSEQDLATFLAYTNADFDERVAVCTTPKWSKNLLALISNQQPPVKRVNLLGLEETTIVWDAYLENAADKILLEARITGHAEVVPDVVVEVASPSESRREVHDQARMWLSHGARLVWVLHPETHTVDVHWPNRAAWTLGENDTLDGMDVLPGFSCLVNAVVGS